MAAIFSVVNFGVIEVLVLFFEFFVVIILIESPVFSSRSAASFSPMMQTF